MATHSNILARKSHGKKNMAGYSPWGPQGAAHGSVTKQQWQPILIPLEKRGENKTQLSKLRILVERKMQPTPIAFFSL